MFYVKDVVVEGYECVMIWMVDIDVVVIVIFCFKKIEQIKELWIVFGVGKIFRYLLVYNIVNVFGFQKLYGFLFFYVFMGCDQVLLFGNKGKKRVWDIWISYRLVMEIFDSLSDKSLLLIVVVDYMEEI